MNDKQHKQKVWDDSHNITRISIFGLIGALVLVSVICVMLIAKDMMPVSTSAEVNQDFKAGTQDGTAKIGR